MPLFGSKHEKDHPVAAQPAAATTPNRGSSEAPHHHGLFSHKRGSSLSSTSTAASDAGAVSRNSSLSHSPTSASGGMRNMLHRGREDPSIAAARQRVAAAEQAERDADAALVAARDSVRKAREEVENLRREAAEEARLARIKEGQAAEIGRRAKPLGRHGF